MDAREDTFDPDLDLQPRPEAPAPVESLERCQRLVANPFLAVVTWLLLTGLIREAVLIHSLPLFLTAIGLWFVALFLVQFHCLDCGKTGWLLDYRRHACPAVVERWQSRTVRRFRGPSVKAQLVGWFICVPVALVLGVILLQSTR